MSAETQQGIFAPETYRELCKPFTDADEAEKSLEAFFDELYELRCKHHITDVHVIVRMPIADSAVMTSFHLGNELLCEPMTAWAFGYEQSQRQSRINKIISDATHAILKREPRK